jgi:hypothetical protein
MRSRSVRPPRNCVERDQLGAPDIRAGAAHQDRGAVLARIVVQEGDFFAVRLELEDLRTRRVRLDEDRIARDRVGLVVGVGERGVGNRQRGERQRST